MQSAYDNWESKLLDPVFMGLNQGKEYTRNHPDRYKISEVKEVTPDWENPAVYQINRLPAKATFTMPMEAIMIRLGKHVLIT